MQIVVVAVPAQEAITLDNVTVRVDAVVYYRVVDPFEAIINVQDYHHAVSQVAQTTPGRDSCSSPTWARSTRAGSLHVLAATVWVGGQLTLAALVPGWRCSAR